MRSSDLSSDVCSSELEFLGDAWLIKGIVIEIIPDEHISRNTSNMFLNQGILISEIHDPVRGKDMFQFQAINTGRVCHFHIKMVIIIVQIIHDSNPEGF